jgi:hypothetical protein
VEKCCVQGEEFLKVLPAQQWRETTENRIESGEKIKLLVPHVLIMDLTHNSLPLWIFLGLLFSCVDAVKGIK